MLLCKRTFPFKKQKVKVAYTANSVNTALEAYFLTDKQKVKLPIEQSQRILLSKQFFLTDKKKEKLPKWQIKWWLFWAKNKSSLWSYSLVNTALQ